MSGMLSHNGIIRAMKSGEISITSFDPYKDENDKRLTPAGFNFSFTKFVISINEKMFCPIYEEDGDKNKTNIYFVLKAGDTALALTRESIWISKKYAGTFHSKVKYVSQGLGHISTTLDPGWLGQLLISINNPNRHDVKIVIAARDNNAKIETYSTFITLCLYKLESPATMLSDNKNARLDILWRILKENDLTGKKEFKRMLEKIGDICLLSANQESNNLVKLRETFSPDDIQLHNRDQNEILEKLDALHSEIVRTIERVEGA